MREQDQPCISEYLLVLWESVRGALTGSQHVTALALYMLLLIIQTEKPMGGGREYSNDHVNGPRSFSGMSQGPLGSLRDFLALTYFSF